MEMFEISSFADKFEFMMIPFTKHCDRVQKSNFQYFLSHPGLS